MLIHLTIEQFALIEKLNCEFHEGLSVITGETGAGKSIWVDAFSQVLGARTDTSLIRPGENQATISALFALEPNHPAREFLTEHDFGDDGECILRRVISNDGRSRAYINGQLVTVQQLRELGQHLAFIHRQHSALQLLKPQQQRLYLDKFANHQKLIAGVEKTYRAYQQQVKLKQQLEQGLVAEAELELLRYQVNELDQAELIEDEYTKLEQEHKKLSNSDTLLQNLQSALTLLEQSDSGSVVELLAKIRSLLSSQLDAFANGQQLIEQAELLCQEASHELNHLLEQWQADPERLNEVENRLTQLHQLARKHQVEPKNLVNHWQQLTAKLQERDQFSQQLAVINNAMAKAKDDYQTASSALSVSRQKAVKKFAAKVTDLIKTLGMPNAVLTVQLHHDRAAPPQPHGQDEVEFIVATNVGLDAGPLSKIVSGGELSRIALALHSLTSQVNYPRTMIFDEVDVGISGAVAEQVGKKLRELAKAHQVITVTHQSQVASAGQFHYNMHKVTEAGTTYAQLKPLNAQQRIEEIARLLAGKTITEKTRSHAKELLEQASLDMANV